MQISYRQHYQSLTEFIIHYSSKSPSLLTTLVSPLSRQGRDKGETRVVNKEAVSRLFLIGVSFILIVSEASSLKSLGRDDILGQLTLYEYVTSLRETAFMT